MIQFYFIKGKEAINFSDFLYPEDRRKAKKGNVNIVGAVDDGTAVGALTWSLDDHTAQIHSIVLADAYRGKGIAGRMLNFFKERVILMDAYEIQADLSAEEDMFHKLDALFKQEGFTVHEGSLYFQVPLSTLDQLPVMKKIKEDRAGSVRELAMVPQRERLEFQDYMLQNGELRSELDWDLYDVKLSFVGFREEKAVCGLFISNQGTGVHIEWMYVEQQDALLFLSALKAAQNAVEAKYGKEARISGVLATQKSEEFFNKLFGERLEEVTGLRCRWYRYELV